MSSDQHEQRMIYEYNSIDLSNKKNIPIDRSRDRNQFRKIEPVKFEKVYNAQDGKYHNVEVGQSYESSGQLENKPYKKSQGQLIKKHIKSGEDVVEYNEVIEPKTIYIKNRNTQTPVREEVDRGIQYDSDDPNIASFKKHLPNQKSTGQRIIDNYEMPFSTIKK
jgi:hypothetical protein